MKEIRSDIPEGLPPEWENWLKTYMEPKFDLLFENQRTIIRKLNRIDDLEVLDTRVSALEAMVKKINRELKELKQAQ